MELITVVVPIYNTNPEYLDECLSCIQKQTYEKLEVLCIDGSSKKETVDVILKYCNNDGRFLLISTEKGVSNQRNIGIKQSRGDYIIFIDSDDYFDCSFISLLYNAIVRSRADISIPKIERTVFDSGIIVEKEPYNVIQIPEEVNVNNYFVYSRSGELVNPIKLYRKSIIENASFRTDMTYGEDLIFNYELAKKPYKTRYVKEAIYYYRVIKGNNSQVRRLDIKGLRIVSSLYQIYKKSNKQFVDNINGIYSEFVLVFKSFYYAAARYKKYIYLFWLSKYKLLYLKKNHNLHDIVYMLFPILVVKRRNRVFNKN